MRFILVDRILKIEKSQEGSFIKNVSHSEDYFSDHFPDSPIMPGVLILEGFDHASQFLVAHNHEFTFYPELKRVLRVSFKHYVFPGDQLLFTLRIVSEDDGQVVIKAQAAIDDRIVTEATLEFTLIPGERDGEAEAHCRRLRALYDLLYSYPVARA